MLVKASIAGAIVTNTLFVLGASFLLGGLNHHTHEYNRVQRAVSAGPAVSGDRCAADSVRLLPAGHFPLIPACHAKAGPRAAPDGFRPREERR
jgi:hypothetical protein